jgi:hypothetical protein
MKILLRWYFCKLKNRKIVAFSWDNLWAQRWFHVMINPLNAELNPICHLVALLGIHHLLHVSRIRVKRKSKPQEKK